MLLVLACVLFILWLVGLIFFKAAKGFIHILLLIAVIVVIVRLAS
jgi:hypothetical protein